MDGWPNGNGACCGAGFNWRARAAAMLSRKAARRACRRFLIAFWSGLTIAGFALALESTAAVGLSRLAVLIEAVLTLGNIGAFAGWAGGGISLRQAFKVFPLALGAAGAGSFGDFNPFFEKNVG